VGGRNAVHSHREHNVKVLYRLPGTLWDALRPWLPTTDAQSMIGRISIFVYIL